MNWRTVWRRRFALVAACSFVASAGYAGTNAGFTVSLVGDLRIGDPEVNDIIELVVRANGTTQVKQVRLLARYESEFFEFVSFTAGNHPVGLQAFPESPVDDGDGFEIAGGGGAVLLGAADTSGGGIIGILSVRVLKELGDEVKMISLHLARVAASATDLDELTFAPGELAVTVFRVFPNKIFEVEVQARDAGAIVTWRTREPGFDDVVGVRVRDSGDQFTEFGNPFRDRLTPEIRQGLQTLLEAGVDPATADAEIIRSALGLPEPVLGVDPLEAVLPDLRFAGRALKERFHIVPVTGLMPDTIYEIRIRSTSLALRLSPLVENFFRTRRLPDLRRLLANNVDIQRLRRGINIGFETNRNAITNYAVRLAGQEDVIESGVVNEDGAKLTRIAIAGLQPGTLYDIALSIALPESQISEQLPVEFRSLELVRQIRTRVLRRALRMAGLPFKIVGPETAQIRFKTTLPVGPVVAYGLFPEGTEGELITPESYTWSSESTPDVRHDITLTNLDPSTRYRYKIEFELEDEDGLAVFSTAPTGNFQWSRDLVFNTSSALDIFDPELIAGPRVFARDVLAIVQFVTDVPTTASVFIGTAETYDTPDEFEFADQVFDTFHSIIAAGLDGDQSYQYRVEFTASNGRTGVVEPPPQAVAKVAGVLQPPGGAGSFTTSNVPDTQFPVILTGPTVSSKTHDTAILEWTTDEPADSEVRFGIDSADEDSETSGVSETAHKLVITGLTPGETYTYLVASTDASGNGATESSTAVFTTNPEFDLTAPAITVAPEIVYKNDETATVQWTTDEDATGQVNFGLSDELGFIRSLPTTEKVHQITLTNLEADTEYFFTVASTDLSNNGPTLSEILSFTTDAQADLTSPELSTIQVAADDVSAIITWTSDELADSFIDFGTVSGLLDLAVGDVEDVTEHRLVLTNLTPDTQYFYTVGSIDRAGNPPTLSAETSFTTLAGADTDPPATPTDLAGTPGSQQVVLTWSANAELDLAGYNVFRRRAGETDFIEIASRLDQPTYTDLGLTNDTDYAYQITAIDRADNASAVTATLSLTPTSAAAPAAPSGLSRSGDDFLRPTFTFTNAIPFQEGASLTYTVQVSTESDFSNVTASESGIAEDASGTTSWTITRDLSEFATYHWRVRAVEGDLIGSFSAAEEFVAKEVVLLPGDFNDDLVVNLTDFFLFAQAFNQPAVGDLVIYDLNGNGSVDLTDFFLFSEAFGTSAVGKGWAFAHLLDKDARLSLEASGGSRAEAGLITVRVWADEIRDLQAFGLVLGFEDDVLLFQQAVEGPGHLLESRGGVAPLFRVLAQRPGELVLANAITHGDPVSGRGLLAELTFQTLTGAPTNEALFHLRQAFIVGKDSDQVRRIAQLSSTRLVPATYFLGANFPNPFNPTTTIDYALPTAAATELVVFDILGRKVRTLIRDQAHPAGFYQITWDGRDEAGRTAGNGVYFYRLSSPHFQQTGKMMLLK